MKYEELKNDFKEQIAGALNDFSATEQNNKVYAIVFDCDLDNGQIVLRYSNQENFEKLKMTWEEYKDMYKPYGQNGLFGLKYNSVGDFPMLKYEYSGMTKHFLDSYYYYRIGDYFGEGESVDVSEISGQTLDEDQLESEMESIFIRMITNTIDEIKDVLETINCEEDHLVFMCDHDISNADFEKWVRKTNEGKLVDKLAQIMD